jgi:hypothetical protein
MNPFCRLHFVSLYCAIIGVYTGELDIFAEVIPTVVAEETGFTGHTRLNGYPVTYIYSLLMTSSQNTK